MNVTRWYEGSHTRCNEGQQFPLSNLPAELVSIVASYLPPRSANALACTSKAFLALLQDDYRSICTIRLERNGSVARIPRYLRDERIMRVRLRGPPFDYGDYIHGKIMNVFEVWMPNLTAIRELDTGVNVDYELETLDLLHESVGHRLQTLHFGVLCRPQERRQVCIATT